MIRRLSVAILVLAGILSLSDSEASAAQAIYVDAAAAANGDGSSSRPYRLVADALDRTAPGDTVRVRPGTYPALQIENIAGTSTAPVLIEGTAPGVVFTDGAYNRRYGILIRDSSHLIVRNFTTHHAIAGVMVQNSSHITIDGLTVYDTGQEGMHVQQGSHDITIQHSHISETGKNPEKVGAFPVGQAPGEGIYIGSGQSNGQDRVWNINILNNEITRTNHEAIDVKAPAHDIVIADNYIHDIRTYVSGAVVFHLNGFNTPDANILFERNVVDGVVSTSPYRDGNCLVVATGATIRNNVLTNCQHRGIFIQDGFPTNADRNVGVFHNTLFNTGSVGAVDIKNGSTAVLDVRNNLGTTMSGNLAADASDFISAQTADFRLSSDSGAVDAATPVTGISADFLNQARVVGQLADFGAFEYAQSSSVTTPPTTTAPSTTTTRPTTTTPPTTAGQPSANPPGVTTTTGVAGQSSQPNSEPPTPDTSPGQAGGFDANTANGFSSDPTDQVPEALTAPTDEDPGEDPLDPRVTATTPAGAIDSPGGSTSSAAPTTSELPVSATADEPNEATLESPESATSIQDIDDPPVGGLALVVPEQSDANTETALVEIESTSRTKSDLPIIVFLSALAFIAIGSTSSRSYWQSRSVRRGRTNGS